jgi:peptidoglycan/LPS O-acetylase OafA/YrhL
VSYGIYLLHVACITAAKHVLPDGWSGAPFVFALALPASVAVASASYLGFERPLLALRDRFRPSAAPARLPASRSLP